MERFEIEDCLKSMEILVDTREQPSQRATDRYESFGCPWQKRTLNFGDYTYNFLLPNGEKLFSDEITVSGHAVIERKMSLTELSGCFCQSRDRFKAEFERATAAGASIYLLVEDATWEKLLTGKYKTKFNPAAFTASLVAWSIRYNIKPIFCRKESSGRIIKEILYRELKERLERGEYG
jgi:ERCC4-type nuclease